MLLPTPLSRRKNNVDKNNFGHVLVVAGSPRMLGAACLTSLSAMRQGAGLVTAAIPHGLNLTLQQKLSSVVMTCPVEQTKEMTFSINAFPKLLENAKRYSAIAIGPGLSLHPSTQKLARRMILDYPLAMVVDADALNSLEGKAQLLLNAKAPRLLTPHTKEMARLTGLSTNVIEKNRKTVALDTAKKYHVVLVLKGHQTIVASPEGKVYINRTGNPGMATAGSGDVLTGMIAGLLAQGFSLFEAGKWGVIFHGQAGDRAIKTRLPASIIATDIIDAILKKGSYASDC